MKTSKTKIPTTTTTNSNQALAARVAHLEKQMIAMQDVVGQIGRGLVAVVEETEVVDDLSEE